MYIIYIYNTHKNKRFIRMYKHACIHTDRHTCIQTDKHRHTLLVEAGNSKLNAKLSPKLRTKH